jgi:hypothetical protein
MVVGPGVSRAGSRWVVESWWPVYIPPRREVSFPQHSLQSHVSVPAVASGGA